MKQFWLKNEFSNKNEFCPVKCCENKGSVFWPEDSKFELDKEDTVIGEYWNDGMNWCFSLFSKYERLSV